MQCKKALEEAGGDRERALTLLRSQGGALAKKKAGRMLAAGTVAAYVHNTKMVGALVSLSCETDFVAKNDEFIKLAYDIAMQVAARNPEYLSPQDVPAGASIEDESILLEQPFIKDESRTIRELIEEAVQKFGERIEINRFIRFKAAE